MPKLLYIESSPRKDRSTSISVAHEFIDAYRKSRPRDRVETLDLWNYDLPEFNGQIINAKYAILHGLDHTPEQAKAWQRVVEVFQYFNSADKYLFGVPMWNFGIPYRLKQFIDVITQPGLAFSFSPSEGYKGLVIGKPAVVIYARGGEYKSGSGSGVYDYQIPYLETLLAYIGFTDIRSIIVEPTLSEPEKIDRVKASAKERAANIARTF
ncbi:MAG: NAD(P)H-dependent oxidoreductase [Planctomycetota bacterium]|nr:MAG: NAD(P)H-dependent oxidoreductase [Planctomycetota bacterium]